MKGSFRQSMSWLHTWTGLIVGWILFFIFVTGTASFGNQELSRWMQPERPLKAANAPNAPNATKQFELAYQYLQDNPASKQAESWNVTLVGDARNSSTLTAGWSEAPAPGEHRGKRKTIYLDSNTGEPLVSQDEVRKTGGGRSLMLMHFSLQYMPMKVGFIIVGICTMFMLVAIATGIVAHKKFFKDFFTFRHGKGLRSWLDAHNVVSVAALPFFIMITYSGLIFFIYTYMPLGVPLTYGFEDKKQVAYYETLMEQTGVNRVLGFGPGGGQGHLTELRQNIAANQPQANKGKRGERKVKEGMQKGNSLTEQAKQFTNLSAIVTAVEKEWGVDQIQRINLISAKRNAPAKIQFMPAKIDTLLRGKGFGNIEFNAVTGERLTLNNAEMASPETFGRVMLGLHEGLFAGPLIRWLYLFSGFLGCSMIATGLVLWTVKRRSKLQKTGEYALGHAVVEKLNITTIAGLLFALAMYFWANRLLPLEMNDRAQWEVHCMFISWLLILIYSAFRPVMLAWRELLALTGIAWLLLPVLNFITTDNHLFATIMQGDWVLASIDLVFIALGIMFGWASWKVHKKIQQAQRKAAKRDRTSQSSVRVEPAPQKIKELK